MTNGSTINFLTHPRQFFLPPTRLRTSCVRLPLRPPCPGLRAVAFNGVRPNAQPTSGRGTKVKELNTHGHFYVFASKAIRMAFKIGTEVSCQMNHTCMYMFCSLCWASSTGRNIESGNFWLRTVEGLSCEGMVVG